MKGEYLEQLIKRYKKHSVLGFGEVDMLLDALIKEREGNTPKKWEPKGGRWSMTSAGKIYNGDSITGTRNNGVEFETPAAAEKAAKYYRKIHRLYKLAEELNEGWEPDWDDGECKYIVAFDYEDSTWGAYARFTMDTLAPHFKDQQTAERAIELIENGALD